MKKAFVLLFMIIAFLAVRADGNLSKVKLKNGVELVGTIVSMDPTSEIVIEIGGINTTIAITDVESVEKAEASSSANNTNGQEAALPNEKIVNIAGIDVKFVLVPAYKFSYGYDGDGSRFVDSEPIHEVEISPFYITEEPISVELAASILGHDFWEPYMYYYSTNIGRITGGVDIDIDMNVNNIKKIAFFCPTFNKSELHNLQYGSLSKASEIFPVADTFVKKLQSDYNKDLAVPTETQYASVIKQGIKDVKFPMVPELVKSVSMNDRKDPAPMKWLTKGLTMQVYPGGFRSNVIIDKLDNRMSYGAHKIKKKSIELMGGGDIIAPMHLTLPAE